MVVPHYIKGVQKQPFANVSQNRCFWKFSKIYRKSPMLEPRFNKVAHVLSYDLCEIFKNIYFLIKLQNQTTILHKQISKSNITEIVTRVFIGILQNIFQSWAITFWPSPKVIFWANCAFLLRNSKIALVFIWWMSPCLSVISKKLQSNFIEIALRHGCSPVNLLQISRICFS